LEHGLSFTKLSVMWAISEVWSPGMPLHYADPHKKHSRWYTALENFGRSRPGQFLSHHLFPRMDPWLYRATGGRYPWTLSAHCSMVGSAPGVTGSDAPVPG